jgi:hypothetical protein
MTIERVEGFTELYENTRAAMFDGDYETATRLIILLAVQLTEHETADVWWIGEHDEFDLASLVVGAYWHYTEWHQGQHSLEYRALSALGRIFSPGHTAGPEEGGELYAYEMLADLAQQEVAA